MLVDSSFIQYINTLPDHCVYALINDIQKEVYINYTGTFISKIKAIYKPGCSIKILSVVADRVYKLIHAEFYALQYINNGYKVINRSSPFISLKPVIGALGSKAILYLSTARRERIIVGIFNLKVEAQEFKLKYYTNWNGLPVYANNEETRRYFRDQVYKQSSGLTPTRQKPSRM